MSRSPLFSLPLSRRGSGRRPGLLVAALTSGALLRAAVTFGADPSLPRNIDSVLSRLVGQEHARAAQAQRTGRPAAVARLNEADAGAPVRLDGTGKVLAHVHLTGRQDLATVESSLRALGAQVLDHRAEYRHGVIAAYLTPSQVEAAARTEGVQALTAELRPRTHAAPPPAFTSQGAVVLRTDLVNRQLGITGKGITVGVLSDSFNTAYLDQNYFGTGAPPATDAQADVALGVLPATVNVLQDFNNGGLGGTDEGRAMCQIIHALAPDAGIAYATAFLNEISFANNIVALRTQANCDVIVDDVGYFDEPVFSDGVLAQAVETVSNSLSLPGKRAVYCSSAGNDGDNGYRSAYRNLTDAAVRAGQVGSPGNLKLTVSDPTSPNYLDPALTAGGWHNWNQNPGPAEPVTTVTAPGDASIQYAIFLQWDDAFDQANGITTDFNFLVFDQDGNYLANLSSTADNYSTKQPFEGIGYLSGGVTYQIAITRTARIRSNAPRAHQLALNTTLNGASKLQGKYFHTYPQDVPNTFGHPAAASAIGCAAYVYDGSGTSDPSKYLPLVEDYTSPGPTTVYLDSHGRRLAHPQRRLKPDVAGVDGVATTFFTPGAYNGSPYTFFGTSAAAPHVAAVAALVVQAAGGPGSVPPGVVKQALEFTAPPRDLDPLFSQARGAGDNGGIVGLSAAGSLTDGANFITVNYFGNDGQSLQSLTIDGSKAGLIFDATAKNPAFTVGQTVGIDPAAVTVVPGSATSPTVTLLFAPGAFVPGATVSFTLDQDLATTGVSGNSADLLGHGATFTAQVVGATPADASTVSGAFANNFGTGYSVTDGYGLVDAFAAVQAVLPATQSGAPTGGPAGGRPGPGAPQGPK